MRDFLEFYKEIANDFFPFFIIMIFGMIYLVVAIIVFVVDMIITAPLTFVCLAAFIVLFIAFCYLLRFILNKYL